MVRLHFAALREDPEFNQFLDEFQAESDRAAAVLGAAYLDDLLNELLLACWVDASAPGKNLLKQNQPLGSFGPRISLAYAVGVIGEPERRDLDLIRELRNAFAHKRHGLSFRDNAITQKCSTFYVVKERLDAEPEVRREYRNSDARTRFNLAVALLAFYLTRRVRNAHRFPHPDPPLWPRYDIGGEQRPQSGGAA